MRFAAIGQIGWSAANVESKLAVHVCLSIGAAIDGFGFSLAIPSQSVRRLSADASTKAYRK
jgi:hypothetical protein